MISFPWDNTSKEVQDRNINSETFATFMYFIAGSKSGIFEPLGNKGLVTSTGNTNIAIQPCYGEILGVLFNETEPQTLTLDLGDSLPRIDKIVIQKNNVSRDVTYQIIKGTPASSPTAPSHSVSGDIYDLVIAQIYVPAYTTEITQSNITDKRLSIDCGVIPAINQIDTSDLFNQYQTALTEFLNASDEKIEEINTNLDKTMQDITTAKEEIQTTENEFDVWFDSIKTEVFDARYFVFDNWIYKVGKKYSYAKTDTEIVETIKNPDDTVFATRTNVKGINTWVITTVCEEFNVNATENWVKGSNGLWNMEVMANA